MRMQQSKEDVLTAGREFALLGLDKYGKVTVFKDTDTYSAMITANIKIEGYQFMLIYKD